MAKKIKITESQLKALIENTATTRLNNQIYDFIDREYIPDYGVKVLSNEYFNTPLIKKKIDGEVIKPRSLKKYLKHKFQGVSDSVIDNIIIAWFNGEYDANIGQRIKN